MLGALLASGCSDSPGVEIEVELATSTPRLRAGKEPRFTVTLVNRGARPVTLVLPGDGSDCGWRTPVIRWTPARPRRGRCGNMNPLQSSEVVTLQPGDRVPLTEWVGSPYLVVPGTQHVSVEYANIPDLECGGVTMAPIGGAAQALVRRSDPVIARSNVVDVVVEPAQVNR